MNLFAALVAPRPRSCVLAFCFAMVLISSGCAGSIRAAAGGGVMIGVTERDFHISTTTAHVSSGEVTLRIHNQGPDEHELIVAPARDGAPPLRRDGFTVNEESIQSSEPGSITPQQPGVTDYLRVHLAPGRYVLFCNMEGHYMGGMHTLLVVG